MASPAQLEVLSVQNPEKTDGHGPRLETTENENPENPQNPESPENPTSGHLTGWRLHLTTTALCASLFLATLEISIVSTSLVSITNHLHIFGQSAWIITAYLLSYSGFLIIWAQFSDVLGRKLFVGLATAIFVVFSGACGGAQTAAQLIAFRVLQGAGGGGMYSMAMIIMSEAVPQRAFPKYISIMSAVFAVAYLVGPLLGGVINNNTTWRWVFLLNLPIGPLVFILTMVSIPNYFPHQNNHFRRKRITKKSVLRVDILGAVLFFSTSTLLVTALEISEVSYPWDSPAVVTCLTLSAGCFVGFVLWERFVTRRCGSQVPILTWRFITNRRFVGLLLSAFLIGAPFTSAVIQIPQRFQVVNGATALNAGIRLLPFIITVPTSCAVAAGVVERFKISPVYALLTGTFLQIIGAASFATVPNSVQYKTAQYGFQVILGLGLGINNAITATAVRLVVDKKDIAAATGAGTQFRILGGAVGLAIITSVLNSSLRPELSSLLTPGQLTAVLESTEALATLPRPLRARVQDVFAAGFKLQWKALLGPICAQVPAALMMRTGKVPVAT